MHLVGDRRRQHHFGVAGEFQGAGARRAIGNAQAAQLYIVLGGDDQLGIGFDVMVAATEFRAAFGEHRLVIVGAFECGLMACRPKFARGGIAQVDKHAPVVARCILAPAGHCQVFPAAITATCVGDHHLIATVG